MLKKAIQTHRLKGQFLLGSSNPIKYGSIKILCILKVRLSIQCFFQNSTVARIVISHLWLFTYIWWSLTRNCRLDVVKGYQADFSPLRVSNTDFVARCELSRPQATKKRSITLTLSFALHHPTSTVSFSKTNKLSPWRARDSVSGSCLMFDLSIGFVYAYLLES